MARKPADPRNDPYRHMLRAARKQSKLSINDLAEELRISKQAVSNWEQGTHRPSEQHLRETCRIVGLDFAVLVHWRD
jgi:transcriptional regulator with XRE-family HTH domain